MLISILTPKDFELQVPTMVELEEMGGREWYVPLKKAVEAARPSNRDTVEALEWHCIWKELVVRVIRRQFKGGEWHGFGISVLHVDAEGKVLFRHNWTSRLGIPGYDTLPQETMPYMGCLFFGTPPRSVAAHCRLIKILFDRGVRYLGQGKWDLPGNVELREFDAGKFCLDAKGTDMAAPFIYMPDWYVEKFGEECNRAVAFLWKKVGAEAGRAFRQWKIDGGLGNPPHLQELMEMWKEWK